MKNKKMVNSRSKYVVFPLLEPQETSLHVVCGSKPSKEIKAMIKNLFPVLKAKYHLMGKGFLCKEWAERVLREAPGGISKCSFEDANLYFLNLIFFFDKDYPCYRVALEDRGFSRQESEFDLQAVALNEMEAKAYSFIVPDASLFYAISFRNIKKLIKERRLCSPFLSVFRLLPSLVCRTIKNKLVTLFSRSSGRTVKKKIKKLKISAISKGIAAFSPIHELESGTGAVFGIGTLGEKTVFIKGFDSFGAIENEIRISEYLFREGSNSLFLPSHELKGSRTCFSDFYGDCSLQKVLETRTLDSKEFQTIDSLCRNGLLFFAKNGLIHGDMRAENIRVQLTEGKISSARICDFGSCSLNGQRLVSRKKLISHLLYKTTALGGKERFSPSGVDDAASCWAFLKAARPSRGEWDEDFYKKMIKIRL